MPVEIMPSPTKSNKRDAGESPRSDQFEMHYKWTKASGGTSDTIDDSEDSPLSPLGNTPSLGEDPWIAASRNTGRASEHPEEVPLEEEIIRVAVEFKQKKRHSRMPGQFEKNGRLAPQWRYLTNRIIEERKAKQSVKQDSNKRETHLKAVKPNGDKEKVTATCQVVINDASVIGHRSPQPSSDTAGIICDQCRESRRNCHSSVDSSLKTSNCLFCVQEGLTCSLSTGRRLRKTKVDSYADPNTRTAVRGRNHIQSRKGFAVSKSKQYPNSAEGSTKLPRSSRGLILGTQTPTRAPSGFSVEVSSLPSASGDPAPLQTTSTVRTNESERGCHIIESNVPGNEEAPSSIGNACETCGKYACSCEPDARPSLDILCDGDTCSKNYFSDSYLQKHIGMRISDALDIRQNYGFWRCPECEHKKASAYSRGPNTSATIFNIPKFGREKMEAEEVRNHLHRFSALVLNHISTARKSALAPTLRMQPLLQIPCIAEEILDEMHGINYPLVNVLRRILGVPPGILLKDMVLRNHLQDLDPTVWIKAVLAFLFYQFVFETQSPFDDVDIWREGLAHSISPFSQALIDMQIQDIRLRTMRKEPASYKERVKSRIRKHNTHMNTVMMPLVGGNADFHAIHEKMAILASDLNTKFAAYTGSYTGILPKLGDNVDLDQHESDDPEDEDKDISDRHIQLTLMLGVKFQLPGKPCGTCAPAKVRLWPTSVLDVISLGSSINSAIESSDRSVLPRKRTFHDFMSVQESPALAPQSPS